MRLTAKVLLLTLGMVIPVRIGTAFGIKPVAHLVLQEGLRNVVIARMAMGGQARCEAAPEKWRDAWSDTGQPGAPRFQLFAYDETLHARHPAAPPLSPAFEAAMREGAPVAERWFDLEGAPVQEVLVRLPQREGPCAYVLAQREGAFQGLGGITSPVPPPLGVTWPILLVLASVLAALLPTLRRVRRLSREMKASSDARYRLPVNERGGDEIADLARTFNATRTEMLGYIDRLEDRERALRMLMADASHDVMIPLTVLQGYLTKLQAIAEQEAPTQRGVVDAAIEETHYLTSILRNLAAASRLDAEAPISMDQVVPLHELVTRAVGRHRPIARQRSVELNSALPEQPIWVRGDATLLEQAISNVIHNAVRYNRPGGHVAVVLEADPAEAFAVRVVDDGPGIPDEELARLEERHFRGSAARVREPDGQGLGLSIARRVANRHGWALRLLRSEYGGLAVAFEGRKELRE